MNRRLQKIKDTADKDYLQQGRYNEEFTKATDEHIGLVRLVCNAMNEVEGMPAKISLWEIATHDKSKFGPYEFQFYAVWFFGEKTPENKARFDAAFMHHIKDENNKHHWRHYLKDFHTIGTEAQCEPLPMPNEQIMIMVADWLAFGYQHTGSWDMSKRMNDNGFDTDTPKVILHPETRVKMDNILRELGWWTDCDNSPQYCIVDATFIMSLSS